MVATPFRVYPWDYVKWVMGYVDIPDGGSPYVLAGV